MERIRSTFRSFIGDTQYSQFSLQPTENGERHAEVNLSDDLGPEEELQEPPSFTPTPSRHNRRTVALVILGALAIFIFGYMVAYTTHRKPRVEPMECPQLKKNETNQLKEHETNQLKKNETNQLKENETVQPPTQSAVQLPEPQLSWSDLTQLLAAKLSKTNFKNALKFFDRPARLAGGEVDLGLANNIYDTFKALEMEPWTDVHYVQLQVPDSNRPNQIYSGSDVFKPKGFLAYSRPGKVTGPLVDGNYGRPEDLEKKYSLNGSVLLLRAGKISFAQQVENAAKKGAAAVLIYPDRKDFPFVADTELYGHVHLGSGDPYTPGFPSFNHTQFPPTESAGLPEIPAQTITANMATALKNKMGKNVTVEVNNVLVNKEIHNVFGVIKGFTDPERFVVLGAQRDAWDRGYAKATVGTAMLQEMAKVFHDMVENDGFRPRRSLIFASWGAGEYGSVGATEWLEGYMSSIDRSVVSYISLDGVVWGRDKFIASASPLLHSLIESTMKEVKDLVQRSNSMYNAMGMTNWEKNVLRPMSIQDPAYPFLAFAGIPSVSFHFVNTLEYYKYYSSELDNMDHLNYENNHRTDETMVKAAQFAGQMALRLVHDHLLSLSPGRYDSYILRAVSPAYRRVGQLAQSGQLADLSADWLSRARGSFQRAVAKMNNDVTNTDVSDQEACRVLNDRLMRVEHSLLSPYVSPVDTPFRHLLFGHGPHTLASVAEATDMKQLRTQLALATWTLQGCANALVGNVWEIDNEI